MSDDYEYRIYRVEWQVQCVTVDQYDQNPKIYSSSIFSTREQAIEYRKTIAKQSEYTGRWIPDNALHSYVDVYVRRVEKLVE